MNARAYILIKAEAGKARWKWLHSQLMKVKGVKGVDAVTGTFDFIATIEGEDFNEIWRTVLEEFQAIDGVVSTLTCNVITI